MKTRTEFIYLNAGHFFDHFFMLIFATASALALSQEWGMEYAQLIPYATPGFVAFGVGAVGAGWLADRWSRRKMLLVFFLGLGMSSILTSLAGSPLTMGCGLLFIGVFASIYHPVGLALVVENRDHAGLPLAINGVFGNLGVAGAALITGFLIDYAGWRASFAWPGIICLATGLSYGFLVRSWGPARSSNPPFAKSNRNTDSTIPRRTFLKRTWCVVFITTALGGFIFQSTTFALPKVMQERLGHMAGTASLVGQFAFYVFLLAAVGQLVVGYLVDRCSLRLVFLGVGGLQATALALMVGISGWPTLAVAVIFMLGVFGQIPINDVIIARLSSPLWRSRIFALRYIVTFTVMASSLPLMAWIQGEWGFDRLFAILAGTAGCIVLVVLALPRINVDKNQLPAQVSEEAPK